MSVDCLSSSSALDSGIRGFAARLYPRRCVQRNALSISRPHTLSHPGTPDTVRPGCSCEEKRGREKGSQESTSRAVTCPGTLNYFTPIISCSKRRSTRRLENCRSNLSCLYGRCRHTATYLHVISIITGHHPRATSKQRKSIENLRAEPRGLSRRGNRGAVSVSGDDDVGRGVVQERHGAASLGMWEICLLSGKFISERLGI